MENSSDPLTLERPVAGGRTLARDRGRVLLVAGGIPGERVRVRLERETKTVAWAEVVEILEASVDRRLPLCDPACGGAVFAHVRYSRQLELKAQIIDDAFRRIGKIALPAPPSVAASPESGYRLRFRLHVNNGRFGFFREGTHTLCDAGATQQLHSASLPAVAGLVARLGRRLDDCDEIVVAENVRATERVVHLLPRRGRRLDDVALAIDDLPDVRGVTAGGPGGAVLLAGERRVADDAAGLIGDGAGIDPAVRWQRQALSFFQANRFLVGALVRRVLDAADADRAIDLYSGVGLFAVALAARGARVTAVEGDPASVEDLNLNAEPWKARLDIAPARVESFVAGARDARPGVVILDPPRAGVTAEALDGVLQWRAPVIVYVSCDPPTLARDAARLVTGGYTMTRLEGFDLFPNTAHVETVATFERRD